MSGRPVVEPLSASHDLGSFDCGNDTLNTWLVRRAPRAQALGTARTFVLLREGTIVGYFAIAASGIPRADAGPLARNSPDPVPVALIARLAVARDFQGRGYGTWLLREALARIDAAADAIGIRAILVHAIDEAARSFYANFGFRPTPGDPFTMTITLDALRAAMGP